MNPWSFGAGRFRFTPSGSNPTPVDVAIITGGKFTIDSSTEELYGSDQFPIASVTKARNVTGEVEFQAVGAGLFGMAVNATPTTGSIVGVDGEAGTIPTTPFTITVAHGANFESDLGVMDTTTGLQMSRGATSTGTGVYAVNTTTGVYTFNTADAGHTVLISYTYTGAAVGKSVTISQAAMGVSTTYQLDARLVMAGTQKFGIRLLSVVVPKLDIALANQSYTKMSATFKAFMPATGTTLGTIYTVE